MLKIDNYGNNIFSLDAFKREQECNMPEDIKSADKSLWNEEIMQPDDSHLALWQDQYGELIWFEQA